MRLRRITDLASETCNDCLNPSHLACVSVSRLHTAPLFDALRALHALLITSGSRGLTPFLRLPAKMFLPIPAVSQSSSLLV